MDIHGPIERAYPKVKPLARALVRTAAEQGATAEELDMAYSMVKGALARRASGILLSELEGEDDG